MANSSIIGKVKNKIVRDFINDKDIVAAIDSHHPDVHEPEDLIYTHIFYYNQNPYTLREVQTFITIQVHIPEDRTFRDAWEIDESFGEPDGFGGENNEFDAELLANYYKELNNVN